MTAETMDGRSEGLGASLPAALRPRLLFLCQVASVLGTLPWVTAQVVAGAVVAPLVFGILGDPATGGNVMQPIFIRLDTLYVVCGGLVLVGEAGRAGLLGSESLQWKHVFRLPLAVGLAALAFYAAFVVHPEMAAIRDSGALRAKGDAWIRFDYLHRLAEGIGKAEVLAGFVLLVLIVTDAWSRARPRS